MWNEERIMSEKKYTCLRRYIKICGEGCVDDLKNARCPNYYPCRIIGVDAITYPDWSAREIQSMLLKKLEEIENRNKKPNPIDDEDESEH